MKKTSTSSSKIDGRRISRLEQEIQAIVSLYIIQNLQAELPGLMTIGRVHVPGDLRTANVYVSLLNIHVEDAEPKKEKLSEAKQLDKALKTLQYWAKEMQDAINKKLELKYIPKLTFLADQSTEKILKIEKILAHMSPPLANEDIKKDET